MATVLFLETLLLFGIVDDVSHCSTLDGFEVLLLLRVVVVKEEDPSPTRPVCFDDEFGGPTRLLLFSTTPCEPKDGRRRGILRC